MDVVNVHIKDCQEDQRSRPHNFLEVLHIKFVENLDIYRHTSGKNKGEINWKSLEGEKLHFYGYYDNIYELTVKQVVKNENGQLKGLLVQYDNNDYCINIWSIRKGMIYGLKTLGIKRLNRIVEDDEFAYIIIDDKDYNELLRVKIDKSNIDIAKQYRWYINREKNNIISPPVSLRKLICKRAGIIYQKYNDGDFSNCTIANLTNSTHKNNCLSEWRILKYKGKLFEKYEISSNGDIRNRKTKKFLRKYTSIKEPDPFTVLHLNTDCSNSVHITIKYAILESYFDYQKENCDIIFKDGNFENICLNNIVVKNKGDKYPISINPDGSINVFIDDDVIIVDEDVYNNIVRKYEWNIFKVKNYKIVRKKGNISIPLHILICEEKFSVVDRCGLAIDHINRNALDNRVSNLRLVHQSINAQNRDVPSIRREKYRGIDYYVFEGRINKKVYKIRRNICNVNAYQEVIDFRDNFIKLREEFINEQINKMNVIEFIRGVNNMKSLHGEDWILNYIHGITSAEDIIKEIA